MCEPAPWPGCGGEGQFRQEEFTLLQDMMGLLGEFMEGGECQQGHQGGQVGGCHGGERPQPVTLSNGQSYTTPGGCTVSFNNGTVNVGDPNGGGGAQSSMAAQDPCGPGRNWNEFSPFGADDKCQNGKQQSWKVWGDPHLVNPDGSKYQTPGGGTDKSHSDCLPTSNGLFTLSDGSQVIVQGKGPDGTVKSVTVVPPGGEANWGQGQGGIDPSQTTIFKDENGKFVACGTVNQYQHC
jgi:hypothetical protein